MAYLFNLWRYNVLNQLGRYTARPRPSIIRYAAYAPYNPTLAGFTKTHTNLYKVKVFRMKRKLKRIHIFTKSLWQIFLVFMEIFGVTSILVYASLFIRPSQDGFDILERYITFIAAYEILVYIILTSLNDIQRDSLLAFKTALELALFYCETNLDIVKVNLVDVITKHQLNNSTLNNLDFRKNYEQLLQLIEAKDELGIKYALLNINHSYEMCELQWRFTFLLRWIK